MDAIENRRSIRKYKSIPIPKNDIENIIFAGMQAPSAKNRQPWRFVIVEGNAKSDMINAIKQGFENEIVEPKLPDSGKYLSSARHTVSVMEQAPVTIFIINPLNKMSDFPNNWEARFYETANIQSVGACIQNMILAAFDMGYGSLWNCDIFFAYDSVAKWLNTDEQIVAAVSFGIPDEKPSTRPRNNMDDIVDWKTAK